MDGGGTLKAISDDHDIMGLTDQLMRQSTVNIFIENSETMYGKNLPGSLISDAKNDIANNIVEKIVLVDTDSSSSTDYSMDNEERLVDIPFIDFNSEADDEREEARGKIRKYVEILRKNLEDTDRDEYGDGGQPNNTGGQPNVDNVMPEIVDDGGQPSGKGPHLGGVMVGREASRGASSISTIDLIEQRNRMRNRRTEQPEEVGQQTSTSNQFPDFSTQQSTTGATDKANPLL
ncbi:hypothetical protein J5N97_010131 [Dioscorea zingiberensis]|uniref:Uncharacterized protein n=1 Tax=Dioscorea zingiberensis TaxID=325984 RepID=A0A9D5CY65_9LILI|nr:hypothetical protein J5N97_010131 [Dioscorea zingiberensis]